MEYWYIYINVILYLNTNSNKHLVSKFKFSKAINLSNNQCYKS